jgi:hypothetical protein
VASSPNREDQLDPKTEAQSRLQQAGPRTGAGAGRRTLFSEYLGAGAMMVGGLLIILSMLLCAATNCCSSTAHCSIFFALLRFDDEQTKLLVEIVSASTSST